MASLWIRRYKPQEELDSLKGETLISDNGTLQGLHARNLDAGGNMHSFGSHLQEASSTKTWGNEPFSKIRKLDGKIAALKKQVYSSEGHDSGAETQQNLSRQGEGNLSLFAIRHTSSKRKNQVADEGKLPMTRCSSEGAVALHTSIQVTESNSQVLHSAVRTQAAEVGILTSSCGKPPLPPSHNKARLPPGSANHKLSSLLARSAGRISLLSPTNSKLVQDVSRHHSHTAVMKAGLAAPINSTGPLLKEGCQFKESSFGCQGAFSKENGNGIEVGTVPPFTQVDKSASFFQKIVPSTEFVMQQQGMLHSEGMYPSLLAKPRKNIARKDFEALDVIASGAKSLKRFNGLENSERASSTLIEDGNTLKTLPESMVVVSSQANQSMEATTSASKPARFPWEMFAGAAGPTRSARDEFVEVYNRARNELKSQKSSSSIDKACYKEMEKHPNMACEQAICHQDTVLLEHERQPLDDEPQRENLDKPRKVEGLDCVAKREGSKVTATCPQLPPKEPLSEKHNSASFLDGDTDISSEKKLQALQSVHDICGKQSSSCMHAQNGCPPAAAGQKNCSLAFEKRAQCRQGFEGAASTYRKPFQAANLEQTDCVPHDNTETLTRLSKKQVRMFSSTSGVITGKESFQCIKLSRKSDAWLQRWYPPYINSVNGSQEYEHSDFIGLEQDPAAGNKLLRRESHEHRACVKEAFKRKLIEKGDLYKRITAGEHLECSKASSEKVLPSAAAMAIVGTAARHFCMAGPQQKGSFTFWSGFGMQTSRTPEHFTEQGKRELTFEVDPSA